uniref:Ground-like domain-containing protein n=1 Tax=Rhabditophanes sp. KR3021 TaxID=114890 RepID=A0AC35UAX8_9BILA
MAKKEGIKRVATEITRMMKNASIKEEGNENAEIIKAGFEMIVVMVPVSSKVITENLEFILMERYKWRITNCNHDKCSMKQTCLLNSINACAIVDTKF